ncbi:MAG: polysaccharide biosynthesis tyrosine autokinase [Acidimicrobiales bacterium]
MIPVDTPGAELGLRDYARALRQHKWAVMGTTLLVTLIAVVVSVARHPVYQAKAEVLVQPSLVQTVLNPSSAVIESTLLQTDVQQFSGRGVLDAVRASLGSTPPVTPAEVGTTGVIGVAANASSPARAAVVANAYANAFVSVSNVKAQKDLSSAVNQLNHQLAALNTQVASAAPGPQRDSLTSQEATLQSELSTLQENAAVSSGGITIQAVATPDPKPISPKRARDIGLGVALGLVLGVGLALVRQYLDDSVSTREDLDRVAGGIPSLGVVPLVAEWRDPGVPLVVTLTDPKSEAAEAYRSLRTAIQFAGVDKEFVTLQVTSAKPGEGKTTTVANLAVALARAGQRVAIASCDLRRPRVHDFFGMDNEVGFTSVALGTVALGDAVQASPVDDRILVLTAGPIPPNPSELLSSKRAAQILADLASMVDVVLVDSPPVLPVTDASVLASSVDATLLVATAGTTTRKDVALAVEALRRVEAPLVGTLLNAAKATGGYAGYAYGYGYGYASGYAPRPLAASRPSPRPRLLGALGRRTPLVLVVTAVAAAIGWFATPATGSYDARAIVNLSGASAALVANPADVSSLGALVHSQPVLALGAVDAGVTRSTASVSNELSISARTASPLVTVTIKDANPLTAESLANGIAASLVKYAASLVHQKGSAAKVAGGAPSILSRATIATSPNPSHEGRNVAGAAAAGLVVSVALGVALERRHGKIRSVVDAERRLSLPVAGTMPLQALAPLGVSGLADLTRVPNRV